MPIRFNPASATAGELYGNPFVGPLGHTAQIAVDLNSLTDDEIDAQGYLKPGIPLSKVGALVGAGVAVFGVTIEPLKVAADNEAATIAALSGAAQVAVGTIGQVNRDVIEDNLGRALTADEVAGFAVAGSTIKLLG